MKTITKLLALALAGTMLAGCLVGCGSNEAKSNDTPLVIASANMSEKFSQFFASSKYDQNVADLTAVKLLGNTRAGEIVYKGIDGETYEYNGTEYTYTGIADCEVTENADGTVDYEFTLREDITFSDGEKLTADDVIFSYYVFSDPSYDGSISLFSLPIEGMEAYRQDAADFISGIQKTGEYSVKVTLTEADATAIYTLAIPVQPLHYYGDEELFDYENHQFGFPKGDLSSVRAKTTTPLGAGPYKFIKYENKIVYMEANENYYKGTPKIKHIQIKTTQEGDQLPGVVQGTLDIAQPAISKEALANMKAENSTGEVNGDKLFITLTDFNGYGYIGMNANNVSVGGDGSSEASRNLRKAIATVLSVYRDVAIDSYYGEAAAIINYPISNTSWAAPQKSDADYMTAYSVDVDGNPIYTEGMSEAEKCDAALKAAVGFFKAAGYTFDENGKMTVAPEGAKMSYELFIPASGTGDHPSIGLVTNASEALKTIGFNLKVSDLADANIMWDALEAETAEIWCAAWSASLDPDMFQVYHSMGGDSNKYAIRQQELDELVMEGRTTTDQNVRKAIYKEALDYIVDYAVEVPIYQRQECWLYSMERVKMDSVTKDQTSFYTWMSEIEKLEMN